MSITAPGVTRRLAFRVVSAVLAFVLLLGGALFLAVDAQLHDYVEAGVESDLVAHSKAIYDRCDTAFDELLTSPGAANPVAARIKKALTLGEVETLIRERRLLAVIVADGEILSRSPGLPESAGGDWAAVAEHRLERARVDNDPLYLYHFQFAPWNWEIIIAKREAEYLHLVHELRSVYLVSLALVALGTLALLYYLQHTIRRPVEGIIESLTEGEPPHYRGIHEFEFLSQHIAAMMESLEKRSREAEAATRAKSEFLANMSHEIRTPMNAVINLSRLALQSPMEATPRSYVEKVQRAGENLLGVINDILDFSKIEAGRLEVEAIPFSPPELVEEVAMLLSHRAEEKGLALRVELPPNKAFPRAVGDPTRITQVLTNLATNAVKFTEQGEVVLKLALEGDDDENLTLRFEVIDSGIGISPRQRERLFEPFQQADGSTTRKYGGTGLGLTISRRLVELMGGELELESTHGLGSRFHFSLTLPRAEGEEAPAEQPAVPSANPLERIRGARVLLVEDLEVNKLVAKALLATAGLEVEIADNGAEALEALERAPVDLVLMDVQMPVMDGFEATRRIRAMAGYHELPIVAMTAHAMAEERRRCLEAGMNDHVAKPIQVEALHAALVRWIPPRAGEGLAAAAPVTGRAAPPAETPDQGRLAEPLRRLIATLDEDLPEARRQLEELEPRLAATTLADEGRRLKRAVEQYETDEALRIARNIATALNPEGAEEG